jgi:hypothetical protein
VKLHGTVALWVKSEEILRRPGLLDKVKGWFGGTPDLRTGRVRASLETAAIMDAARTGLRRLGIDNAVSLLIDDIVLFQDKEGRTGDLVDLFVAFSDHASVLGGGFRVLRLAVEHEEAGLHLVIELQARTEHPGSEPAMRAVISGRLRELEPGPGEDAEAYRRRVEPLTRDPARIAAHKEQFESFVARVRDALRVAMPEAQAEILAAQARVERPSKRAAKPAAPTSPNYDPYQQYYPHPLDGMLSVMMWTSIFSMAMRPDVVVVNEQGDPIGNAQDDAGAGDFGGDQFDDGGAGGGDGADGGDGGDFGGDHFGGDDFGGGDLGGDFGGGFDW